MRWTMNVVVWSLSITMNHVGDPTGDLAPLVWDSVAGMRACAFVSKLQMVLYSLKDCVIFT